MIKTFRGLIADGGQDTIVLHTNNGSVGYRVVKFQVVTYEPMNVTSKSVVKIYSIKQTLPATATIDFSDNTLLGMGLFSCDINAYLYPEDMTIIFDRNVFNQDIYITHQNKTGSGACNYYLELEQIMLDLSANTVATLKDIRNTARTSVT